MHSYLRSIGMSEISSQAEIEEIIDDIVREGKKKKKCKKEDSSTIVEYTREYSRNTGIKVVGEEDQLGDFHFKHYFPYCKAEILNTEDEIYINKRVDTDAVTGMCDDYRLGVSLIFYVQNLIDYYKIFKAPKCINENGIRLAALAAKGTILLPTLPRVEDSERMKAEIKNKNKLIAEAKKGNQEAIESLTLDDIDKYAIVSQRIKNEDLFSIVDTTFIPYGSESDLYNVVGNIITVSTEKNTCTGEKIWNLLIECNDLYFNVAINSKDLLGEPAVGRRFKGCIWMQGHLEQILG